MTEAEQVGSGGVRSASCTSSASCIGHPDLCEGSQQIVVRSGDARIVLDPGGGLPRFLLDISRGDDGMGFDVYAEGYDLDPVATTCLLFTDHPEHPGNPSNVRLEHSDEVVRNTHDPSYCANRPCPVHRRSDHPMRAMRQHWRDDRRLMERICEHGVGHPDPDSPPWTDWVHGCDGCCCGPSYEIVGKYTVDLDATA